MTESHMQYHPRGETREAKQPVATGGVGADERLRVLELLLHIPNQLSTFVALKGAQEQFWPHLSASNVSHALAFHCSALVQFAKRGEDMSAREAI